MPKRTEIKRVLVIGSGPIVIGQACEFDYSGTQACKALRDEGLEVILVNSNPATIMTDPELADRTYVEPLTPEVLEKIIAREKPDAILPTVGGQTALNLAVQLDELGILKKYNVELIGASIPGDQGRRGSPAVPRCDEGDRRRRAGQRRGQDAGRGARDRRADRIPGHHPPLVHHGRRRRRHCLQPRRVQGHCRPRPAPEPGPRNPRRDVGHRLEGIRARGDARRRRQLRRHLLDREHRPDGRAHRRQHHRRAGADADRQGIPAHARLGPPHHPPRRRRDRRLQHPVRHQPGRWPDDRDRDEPARVAVVGAGVEGHRLPDCQDRRQAGARLSPRRDPQRHHARHAGVVRADHRLRGRQVPALELREVPAGRPHADDADEVGGRGHGDWPHLQGSVPEGRALAGARQGRPAVPPSADGRERRGRGLERGRRHGAAPQAGDPDRPPHVGVVPRARQGLGHREAARADQHGPVVPAAVQGAGRAAQDGRDDRPARHVVRPDAHAQARRLRRRRAGRHPRRQRDGGAREAQRAEGEDRRSSASTPARRSSSRSRRTCTAASSTSARPTRPTSRR